MKDNAEFMELYRPQVGDHGDIICRNKGPVEGFYTVTEINGNSLILSNGPVIEDYLEPQDFCGNKICFFNVSGYWRYVTKKMFED